MATVNKSWYLIDGVEVLKWGGYQEPGGCHQQAGAPGPPQILEEWWRQGQLAQLIENKAFKGIVSRQVRPMLLNIVGKLSL